MTDEREPEERPAPAPVVVHERIVERRPLVLRVAVPMTEATKVREQLATEWVAEKLDVRDEATVVRAVGHALQERIALQPLAETVALTMLTTDGPTWHAVNNPGRGPFKDVVRALNEERGSDPTAPVTVVSYTAFGVDSAEPRLPDGAAIAVAMARPVVTTAATLTLVYDPEQVEDHVAAALLGRIRELLVQPYALLAE